MRFLVRFYRPVARNQETYADRQNENLAFRANREPNRRPRKSCLAEHHADVCKVNLRPRKALRNGLKGADEQCPSGEENEASCAGTCNHANGDHDPPRISC